MNYEATYIAPWMWTICALVWALAIRGLIAFALDMVCFGKSLYWRHRAYKLSK